MHVLVINSSCLSLIDGLAQKEPLRITNSTPSRRQRSSLGLCLLLTNSSTSSIIKKIVIDVVHNPNPKYSQCLPKPCAGRTENLAWKLGKEIISLIMLSIQPRT